MPSETPFEVFPYREEDVFKRGSESFPIQRPTLNVELRRGDLDVTVSALVDTGAPFTLFARGVGEALGVDFGSRTALRADHHIGGDVHEAQLEHVLITLPPFAEMSWETEIGFFVTEWKMSFAGVLGHQGFLDRWAVSFNYSADYFVVEEPQVFADRLPPDYNRIYEERDLGWRG